MRNIAFTILIINMEMHVSPTQNELIKASARIGYPGFSERLKALFEVAGVLRYGALTWASERWMVAPNTVKHWLLQDRPPQHKPMLEMVVDDLLTLAGSRADRTRVLGWLYVGGKNPMEEGELIISQVSPESALLTLKIVNALSQELENIRVDINQLDENEVVKLITTIAARVNAHEGEPMINAIRKCMPSKAELLRLSKLRS